MSFSFCNHETSPTGLQKLKPSRPRSSPSGPHDPPDDRDEQHRDEHHHQAEQPERAVQDRLRVEANLDGQRRAGEPVLSGCSQARMLPRSTCFDGALWIADLARQVHPERDELIAVPPHITDAGPAAAPTSCV